MRNPNPSTACLAMARDGIGQLSFAPPAPNAAGIASIGSFEGNMMSKTFRYLWLAWCVGLTAYTAYTHAWLAFVMAFTAVLFALGNFVVGAPR